MALLRLMLAIDSVASSDGFESNGGFENGLTGWAKSCEHCGITISADTGAGRARSGRGSAWLRGPETKWSSTGLVQSVPLDLLPSNCGPGGDGFIVLEAYVRNGPGGDEFPAASVQLSVRFATEDPASPPGCRLERDWPFPAWERLQLRCAAPSAEGARPPAGGQPRLATEVRLSSVRSAASVLLDDVSLRCESVSEAETPSLRTLAAEQLARSPAAGDRAPPLLHFVFGLSRDFGGKPFGLAHHLVIKAAIRHVQPYRTYMYLMHEPQGEWWDRTKPWLWLRHVVTPKEVMGKPLRKFAHQADVVRLEVLLQFGGVYMDLDILVLKPLRPLFKHDLVLAQEGISGSIGLGNSLMICRPNATFLRAWYDKYRDFSDQIWNYYSVRLPSQLARTLPDHVHVLDYATYFWPPWNPWGIAQLYRTPRCMMPHALAVHLWETKVWDKLLKKLTPERLAAEDSCYTILANAIYQGHYNFSKALLAPGKPADDTLHVQMSRSLLSTLVAQS